MIGKLKGKLIEVSGNIGLVETIGGVCYEVFITPKIISNYQSLKSIELYTYLQVREDALILFGFETKKEYDFFKLLLAVSGVGPKTAFAIISFINVDSIISAIKKNDVEVLTQIPGLGKKTAMKIILELSSKLKTDFDIKNIVLDENDKTFIEALISLGYKSQEAKKILTKIPKNLPVEEKIKIALRK